MTLETLADISWVVVTFHYIFLTQQICTETIAADENPPTGWRFAYLAVLFRAVAFAVITVPSVAAYLVLEYAFGL